MTTPLAHEWTTLQNQYDAYERSSLHIKLMAVLVLLVLWVTQTVSLIALSLLCVLWLQDAIWKTFQSRIETRLLRIETTLAEFTDPSQSQGAYQFNREFEKTRPSTLGLVTEYVKQACRPTVAYPHLVLLLLGLLFCFF